ncbi:HAMP domain-containing methyl-accepting chemotaxis protein [Pseudoalteromonas phenolica]|uniref:Methyl-accepting chemotaxis protein n=1 Tax=Pseudoalteromonas phenolica TaxID=161398 RepID=A0A0S2K3A6_9GAMM|nr:methyl-accepting chemotaxis protein [Pseudoalteromonas phenolica]ALO42600.1 Methyl-accepting chemotaxis protein [Pseudoalteromonas phenolica]MBE0356294.1 methyl-accepting chemotaxis protein [Pseudoalteromonas phenolica O-BC30]
MKLTVSLRIFGGFAILLLLSIVIYLVALMGIRSIGSGVEQMSEKSVPTLIAGADLAQNILITELSLIELSTTENEQEATRLRDLIKQANQSNNLAIQSLSQFIEPNSDSFALLKETKALNTTFLEASDQVITDYFKLLTLLSITQERAREFGDMGDESLSLAYDLEGLSEDESINDSITEFVTLIESSVDEANAALASNITFEILSIESALKDSKGELKSLFNKFSQSPELRDDESVSSMADNLERFLAALVGEQSAIKARLDSLKRRKEVSEQLKQAQQLGDSTREILIQLNDKIKLATNEIKNDALESVSQHQLITTVLTLITLCLSASVAYFVTNSIKKPLHHAVTQIKQAATGDMTVHFTKMRDDELGELADNMQSLVNTLRQTLKEIAHNSNSLATTAEETNTIAKQSFDSASSQNDKMQVMTHSIAEMTDTVQSVSNSIHHTLEQVEKSNNDAEQGQILLNQNIDNIHLLADAIKQSATVIETLNDDTNNISSVLDIIRGVAEQTNLLALNAAIEAARAGEQGRGFAVVADEVRTLASKAHDATQEIQQAIENLQQGAKQAVATMSKSQQETQQCVDGIQNVDEMLGSILSGITNIKDMSQHIATAAEQQSIAAVTQNENMKEMQHITELSASHAEENNQASQQLASMAETQRELLSKFKT